ncbi:hypothetical protein Tco_0546271, partial [Tanacetum coccineum]
RARFSPLPVLPDARACPPAHFATSNPTSGLMEACVPTDNCSFGRRTIPTRKISQEFDAMRFPAIPSPTEDGNYACLTEPSSAGTVFNQCMQNLECSSSSEKQKKTSQENQTSSEVHPEPNSKSVPTCVSTDRADMSCHHHRDQSLVARGEFNDSETSLQISTHAPPSPPPSLPPSLPRSPPLDMEDVDFIFIYSIEMMFSKQIKDIHLACFGLLTVIAIAFAAMHKVDTSHSTKMLHYGMFLSSTLVIVYSIVSGMIIIKHNYRKATTSDPWIYRSTRMLLGAPQGEVLGWIKPWSANSCSWFDSSCILEGANLSSSFISAVPGQMTYLVVNPALDRARSYVMQGAFLTQGVSLGPVLVFSVFAMFAACASRAVATLLATSCLMAV